MVACLFSDLVSLKISKCLFIVFWLKTIEKGRMNLASLSQVEMLKWSLFLQIIGRRSTQTQIN